MKTLRTIAGLLLLTLAQTSAPAQTYSSTTGRNPGAAVGTVGDCLVKQSTGGYGPAACANAQTPPPVPVQIGSTSITTLYANEAVTGTTANKLVKIVNDPQVAKIITTADTIGVFGICTAGTGTTCGTTGSAQITVLGTALCVFDGATTANDYVIASTTVAGDCHDSGSGTTYPTGVQVVGRVTETAAAGARSVTLGVGDVASVSAQPGGKGTALTINGTNAKSTVDLNTTTPAAPAGSVNVTMQISSSGNTSSVSAYVPIAFYYGGDGSDGALTFDGTTTYATLATTSGVAPNLVYTLTRDALGTTIVVSSGITVNLANFGMFGTVSITNNGGTINNNGNAGVAGNPGVSNAAGGGGSGAGTLGADPARFFRFVAPVAGQTGATGVVGVGVQPGAANAATANGGNSILLSPLAGNTGASGGAGGNGTSGSGGTARAGSAGASAPTLSRVNGRDPITALRGFTNWYNLGGLQTTVTITNGVAGGSNGGSSGAGDGANAGGGGGGGGQEGGSAGLLVVSAPIIVNSGTISANGGTGGNGANGGTRGATGNCGGGGGGGAGHGGRGGIVWIIARTLTNSGTISANGGSPGTPGNGGAGSGTGTSGSTGGTASAGNAGVVIQLTQ